MPVAWQGPGGVANLHVETAIDEASGKLTMLYQARAFRHSLQALRLCEMRCLFAECGNCQSVCASLAHADRV